MEESCSERSKMPPQGNLMLHLKSTIAWPPLLMRKIWAPPFVRGRAWELTHYAKFLTGEWVDIQPMHDLTGWYSLAGDWSVDDSGALIGKSDDQGLEILCGAKFGTRYVLSGEVTLDASDEKDPCAGAIVGWTSATQQYGLMLHPASKRQTPGEP